MSAYLTPGELVESLTGALAHRYGDGNITDRGFNATLAPHLEPYRPRYRASTQSAIDVARRILGVEP